MEENDFDKSQPIITEDEWRGVRIGSSF
jgi:hypothetical protein